MLPKYTQPEMTIMGTEGWLFSIAEIFFFSLEVPNCTFGG